MRKPLTRCAAALLGIAVAAGCALPARAELADVRVLAEFDRAAGQNAESVALEPGGGAVVGMINARQVVRVRPDGGTEVLTTMPVPPDLSLIHISEPTRPY